MLPLEQPDRIHVAFDDHRLVANAGLLLPVTLARHLGLGELVDRHVDLGGAPGRANVGDKMLTLVASALAGGDCIDDADALRAGGTDRVLGCVIKAPSTLGTFLRSFRWGHVRQLDRVSRELLAGAWAAGAGPGDAPFTIDLVGNGGGTRPARLPWTAMLCIAMARGSRRVSPNGQAKGRPTPLGAPISVALRWAPAQQARKPTPAACDTHDRVAKVPLPASSGIMPWPAA